MYLIVSVPKFPIYLVEKLVEGLKPILPVRNIILNSDAAQNYKHMFGPHRGLYLSSETHLAHNKDCDETKLKVQCGSEEHKKNK